MCPWDTDAPAIAKFAEIGHCHLTKGHNSDNNRWILSIIELDLYFMIIYLCMKYESNSQMYSKDIARKPFFVQRSRAITLIIIGGFCQ